MAADSLINLSTTLGAIEVGAVVCYFLFGVLTSQVYAYSRRFPTDSAKLKTLVTVVWLMQLGQIVCVGSGLFTYTISNYGHPETVVGPLPKSLAGGVLLGAIVIICVQGFFSFRLYAFSKRLFVPIFIWVVVSVRFIGGMTVMVTALRMNSIFEYEIQWGWLITVFWGLSAVSDLSITWALVALFLSQRPSGQKRTVALIDKLILWTLETGVLTSATMIVEVVCFYTMKDNFIWAAFFVLHTSCGVSIILRYLWLTEIRSLNSRATLRAMNDREVSLQSFHPTAIDFANSVQVTPDTEGIIAAESKMSHV
ncbi:hypothetical protein C8F04DRAFT_1254566 [Mycena alexandri]|uniref:DUF6534 domain-containing protein n=1 Tax=Mycena alexandri TaxID=1745969 RepID=A0AAD6T7B6_9AGAR|nr:hypothetical protein C8F04DRAFT_1254566 [Mycena alexandri]